MTVYITIYCKHLIHSDNSCIQWEVSTILGFKLVNINTDLQSVQVLVRTMMVSSYLRTSKFPSNFCFRLSCDRKFQYSTNSVFIIKHRFQKPADTTLASNRFS